MFVNLRVDETQHIYIESSYGVIGVETTQRSQRYSIRPIITDSLTLNFLIICLSVILVFLVVCCHVDDKQKHFFVPDGS